VSAAWPEPDRALFSISVAAELSGLHAQTLRVYEREGLLEPARTPGGTRRYSGNEIDRLREIAALVDDGVNIAGMRRVLNLEQRIRHLQAEVSGVEALKQEARRLKAELALAMGQRTRRPAKRRPEPA
jgi:MerR family transcriptional regulator, heat shock protein HspR